MNAHIPHTSPETVENEQFEYRLLVEHGRTNHSIKTDEQLRMEYLQLTDGLIYKMTNGVEVKDPETGEMTLQKPDTVIWLDKSARPVAWFVKELWPTMAKDPVTGETPEMPDFKFLNIDREQWVNSLDPEGNDNMNLALIDKSIIRSLRSIFISPKHKKEGITAALDDAPTDLDDKTVLIVDEVYSTGRTLKYAKAFLELAFPETAFGSAHWMSKITLIDGVKQNADLPVWYKDDTVTGRGVGNRNDAISSRSNSMTQRLGRYFLSTRLNNDKDARDLRAELRELATNPDVPVRPSPNRKSRDVVSRLEAYNNGDSAQLVMSRVHAIAKQRR
jgi:hypothetical protein